MGQQRDELFWMWLSIIGYLSAIYIALLSDRIFSLIVFAFVVVLFSGIVFQNLKR